MSCSWKLLIIRRTLSFSGKLGFLLPHLVFCSFTRLLCSFTRLFCSFTWLLCSFTWLLCSFTWLLCSFTRLFCSFTWFSVPSPGFPPFLYLFICNLKLYNFNFSLEIVNFISLSDKVYPSGAWISFKV